jgi:hypothetical protein
MRIYPGLTPEVFWRLSLREYTALVKYAKEE